jgi:hypothetical protein
MTDHDIHAFGAATTAPAGAPTAGRTTSASQRRRRWPWVLGALLALSALMMLALTLAIAGLAEAAQQAWQVVIHGHEWDGLSLDLLDGSLAVLGSVIGVVTVALVVVIVVVLVVPVVVLLALLVAGGGVGLALAAVLLSLALVAAVVLSPLWLLWLLWLLLRRRSPAPATATPAGATMSS